MASTSKAKDKMAMQMQQIGNGAVQPKPTSRMAVIRQDLMSPAVSKIIQERIGQDRAPQFISSVLDLIGSDSHLAQCNPQLVIKECLKAAALNLIVSKSMGFAWVIPYNKSRLVNGKWEKIPMPEFQVGYKGIIQLALRTGQYKHLNADALFEGETVIVDRIKGTLKVSGERTSDKVIGFFSYFELLNGFEKGMFWTVEKMMKYGEKHSPGYNAKDKSAEKEYTSKWRTDLEPMGIKTMLKQLLSKYGPMSIEMQQAFESDRDLREDLTPILGNEISTEDAIDITDPQLSEEEPTNPDEMTDEEKAEIIEQERIEAEKERELFEEAK